MVLDPEDFIEIFRELLATIDHGRKRKNKNMNKIHGLMMIPFRWLLETRKRQEWSQQLLQVRRVTLTPFCQNQCKNKTQNPSSSCRRRPKEICHELLEMRLKLLFFFLLLLLLLLLFIIIIIVLIIGRRRRKRRSQQQMFCLKEGEESWEEFWL
jgi:cbb3-type cytochrome oxidase subunit 3